MKAFINLKKYINAINNYKKLNCDFFYNITYKLLLTTL